MGIHAYKRQRLIGTHIRSDQDIPGPVNCTTDIRDNGYSRQEYPVPRRPI